MLLFCQFLYVQYNEWHWTDINEKLDSLQFSLVRPQFGTVLVHLSQMKHLILICRYVEPFQSYVLPIDDGPGKLTVFPRQIFRGRGKYRK